MHDPGTFVLLRFMNAMFVSPSVPAQNWPMHSITHAGKSLCLVERKLLNNIG